QILVVCLVILDALLVLGELLMDLKIIHPDKYNIAPKVFHYLSLSILTIFLVEVGFKVFVYRREFFHHKFEVLDGVVVVVSFILDVVLIFREHEFEAVGLLILLRLGRVARIINGIILSVKTRSEQQVSKLKQANLKLATKVEQLEHSCVEKEQEIERLNKILKQHGLISEQK
ncbi:Voltage-gated hydrogen channel 1, partial [Cathartes aura]